MSVKEIRPLSDEQARLFFSPYLTKDEVVELCGTSRGTLENWIKEGLPVVRIGERTQRIKRTSLDEFLDQYEN